MKHEFVTTLLLVAMIVFFVDAATADVIRLKNGNTLEGEIQSTDAQHVTIDVPGAGKLTLDRSEITSVEQSSGMVNQTGFKELNRLSDAIRAATPTSIHLTEVSTKQESVLVKGTLQGEPGAADTGQLERYIGLLQRLPGVAHADVESIRRFEQGSLPVMQFTLSVWSGAPQGKEKEVTAVPEAKIPDLLEAIANAAKQEGVKIRSIAPAPQTNLDGKGSSFSVVVELVPSTEPAVAQRYIQHVERIARECSAKPPQTYEESLRIAFDCNLTPSTSSASRQNPEVERHIKQGDATFERGDYEPAITEFKQAIQEDSNAWMAYLELAMAYKKVGKWDEAKTAANEAVRLNPQLMLAWSVLGDAYVRSKEYDQAAWAYERAVQSEPKEWSNYLALSIPYMHLERWAECIKATTQALQLSPSTAEAQARFNLGICNVGSGNLAAARAQYEQLKKLDPKFAQMLLQTINAQAVSEAVHNLTEHR